jgi:hypothetical protein
MIYWRHDKDKSSIGKEGGGRRERREDKAGKKEIKYVAQYHPVR